MTPKWLFRMMWFGAGIRGTGALWNFLSQRDYLAVVLTVFAAVVVVLLAVALYIRNDRLRSEQQTVAANPNPAPEQPTSAITAQPGIVDFVLVTALEEERDAVLDRLSGYQQLPPFPDDIRTYFKADLPVTLSDGHTGVYQLVVMPLLGMGRVQAGMATADAIRRWHPRYVVLIGIAGGIANRGVRIGDILISDQIVDYELQKLTPQGPQIRWDVQRADPRLLSACMNFRGESWQELIRISRPDLGKPQRHIGPIASGDKVIAFDEVLTRYRDVWPKLIGVEMEAAGVAAATFQSTERPGFFMVRCVSDLADEQKGSGGVEEWRPYACEAAASFAVALLKNGPIPLLERNGIGSIKPEQLPSANLSAEVTPSVTRRPNEPKVYLQEKSPDEIVARIKSLNPLERDPVAKQTYVGHWVRWSGTILRLEPYRLFGGEGYTVTVDGGLFAFARLGFLPTERHLVEPLQEGDLISYEAKITHVFSNDIHLTDVTLTRPEERSFVDVTPEDLGHIFEEYTEIQAKMRVADIIDKWMKVSGPLENVGNFTSFSQVTFGGSLSFHPIVYMYFRKKRWVDRLLVLNRGDNITVVGRIREVRAGDLHLDNCELMDS